MERHWAALLGAFTALYFLGSAGAAKQELLWFDEYFTLDLAHLPTVGRLFDALNAGADFTPVLFHLATRAAVKIAGFGLIALRLPGMVGFWVASICLFIWIRRRLGATCAFVALLAPLLSGAEAYTAEARGYGLMLGFCGIALLAWHYAANSRPGRIAALLTLAFALAGAVLSHYYAIGILAPLTLAEIVRWLRTRRADWPMWLAFSGAVIPLIFVLPIIRKAQATGSAGTFDLASPGRIPSFYQFLLEPAIPVLSVFFVLAVLLRGARKNGDERKLPAHELALAIALFCAPVAIILGTTPLHSYFHPRYVIYAALGFGALAAAIAGRALITALVFLVVASFATVLEFSRLPGLIQAQAAPEVPDFQSVDESTLPVYVQEAFTYVEWAHTMPRQIVQRMRMVADPPLAKSILGKNIDDLCARQLSGWGPVTVVDYQTLQSGPRQFLLIYTPGISGWLMQKLVADGVDLKVLESHGDALIFQATLPLALPLSPPHSIVK